MGLSSIFSNYSQSFVDLRSDLRPFLLRPSARPGFTLVEMLVAMAITLILIFALTRAYAIVGEELAQGRAVIELSGSLRSVAHQLQRDLEGVTVPVRPWTNEVGGAGYFEIIDGPATDTRNGDGSSSVPSILGDVDDVLAFTAYSTNPPFVGMVMGEAVESTLAEIVWWIHPEDIPDEAGVPRYVVSRRVLLIRPDLEDRIADETDLRDCWDRHDLSVRLEDGEIRANSLADLTLRQNRFARNPIGNLPYFLNREFLLRRVTESNDGSPQPHPGDDVKLANALAFDVQVFDPHAEIREGTTGEALIPSDPGWSSASQLLGRGAFVDLGYAHRRAETDISDFSRAPRPWHRLAEPPGQWESGWYTYCTWSTHYEEEQAIYELAEDLDIEIEFDFEFDLREKRVTSPPYPVALRGIRVGIRAWDPASRQVRQKSVVSSFVPE